MNNYNFSERLGSTSIDVEQLEGIKYSHIITMAELDEVEDKNIQEGLDWLNRQKKVEDFLSIQFLNSLHKKLFGDVWLWAGTFRKRMVNLSKTDPFNIGPELKNLFEDTKVWIENGKMGWEEIFAEFHHRLVSIHPYPNGNGRLSRIMTEYLQERSGQPITSWKASLKESPKERRDTYIKALQEADAGDYSYLINFMKEKWSK